jgi:hypothetical protein
MKSMAIGTIFNVMNMNLPVEAINNNTMNLNINSNNRNLIYMPAARNTIFPSIIP